MQLREDALTMCRLLLTAPVALFVAVGVAAVVGRGDDAAPPTPAAARAHPLQAALAPARSALARLDQVAGYTCRFVKREQIDGELTEHEFMRLKLRHEPFAVYLYCLGPSNPEGQQVLYAEGTRGDKVLVRRDGISGAVLGTLELDPNGGFMMGGNRYPVTNIGVKNLLRKLVTGFEEDMTHDGSDQAFRVRVYRDAHVDDRAAECVEVTASRADLSPLYQRTRTYYDKELGVPVRFEAYGWPAAEGEEPPLVEEYTYSGLDLEAPLSEADFDPANPEYGFE